MEFRNGLTGPTGRITRLAVALASCVLMTTQTRLLAQTGTFIPPPVRTIPLLETRFGAHVSVGASTESFRLSHSVGVRYDFFGIEYGKVAESPDPIREITTKGDTIMKYTGSRTGIDALYFYDMNKQFSLVGGLGVNWVGKTNQLHDSILEQSSVYSLGVGAGLQYYTGLALFPNTNLMLGTFLHTQRGICLQVGLWGENVRRK